MADENQNRERLPTSPDELGRELNSTLAQYAAVEPRTGLEDRVLANLRAEREHVPERGWWRWGLAAALAAVIIGMALTLKSGRLPHAVAGDHPSATTIGSMQPGMQARANGKGSEVRPLPRSARSVTTRNHAQVSTTARPVAEPKLDHFPSRQPLSAQELALARYVSEFPQEATVIARVQEEYEKEIQRAMKDTRAETEGYGSDQQER